MPQLLQQRLGYQFSNLQLLQQALTHRSFSSDHNERLEFLGDSVLGLIIAESIFSRFPEAREGQMSRLRSQLVKGETLAEVARELDFAEHLRLGVGERKTGGQQRESILENTVEALIGAIYLDSNLAQTKQCVLAWFSSRLDNVDLDVSSKDPKSRLQEYLQGRKLALPHYQLVATSGVEHCQEFTIECQVESLNAKAQASANSRKKAEQAAASSVLEQLKLS